MDFLQENLNISILYFNGEPIGLELPVTVELAVVQTDPSFKGDTASGGGKPATLETGLVVQVPFFINEGDRLKIDTRTGDYMERVKN
jgi:elongation factor P